jgi:hypothetical protein
MRHISLLRTKCLSRCSILGFVTLLLIGVTAPSTGAQVFTFGERYATGSLPECIVTGNFNDDSYTDIAVSHHDTNLVLIYMNDGNAGFSESYSLDWDRQSGLHSADFNGDGLDDLASFDMGWLPPYDWGTTVRLNNGDGTFDLVFQDTLGWSWRHMCIGDFNSDNRNDIAVYYGFDNSGIWMYIGIGDGTFEEPIMVQPFPSEMWLDAADLDNDGDVDIICASEQESFSLLNDGSGQFAEPLLAGGVMNSMALASLNGDDFPDLIGKGIYGCSGVPHYMIGDGDGTFGIETRAWLTAGVLLKSYVMSADFNSDGYGDIAYYSYDMDSVMIGFNDGRQVFVNIQYINEVGTAGGAYLEAGDFDNDGDLDLAITGQDDTLSIALSLGAQHLRRMYVPDDFPTIQDAIDYAWNLDTIIVGPGIYYENIDFGGKNLVLMSSEYADKYLFDKLKSTYENSTSTIIDGGGSDRVFTFDDGEDDRSVVAGFTIQNGYAVSQGGGIYIAQSTSGFSSPIIMHNIIKDNHSDFVGGGILIGSGTVTIKYNLIVGNSAASVGGGIYVIEGKEISNNTFYGNSAVSGGGGICYNSGSPNICNNVFWSNSSTNGEQEIKYIYDPPDITYSIVQGGWLGEGNLDEDPMFVDPDNGDFNLMEGSPCIDAGDPNMPYDADGTIADLGAICYLNPTDVEDEEGEFGLPRSFIVSQNYPNPFNPMTEIEFALPKACQTKLEIINVLGQRVTTLVDQQMAAGYHTVSFDGSKMASGVYLYRLQAGDFVESKKMMLIK